MGPHPYPGRVADDLTTMLAAMAASYPDAVVVAGVDGCVRYVNPTAERLFGATAAGLQGKHVSLLSSADEQARSHGLAARIVAGEHVATPSVMEMQREDGSTFFAEVTLSPLVGDDGGAVGLLAVGHDVTARIAAEADAARLRAIVDAANEAILGVDTDGTVLFFSPSAERLFGWSAGEIIGRSGDDLVAPKYRIGPPRLFAELATNGSFRRPTVALRRDGTHVEVELSAAEIIGKHGSVIGAALTVMDVSERKRTRRLLDRIIEHAPNAIAVKDLDGRYLGFSWQSADGPRRDFVGLTDADLLPADMARRSEQQDREVLAGGEPMTFHDEFESADGHVRAFVTTKFPLPGPDGETEAVGVIASDVTELRRAEADQAQLAALVRGGAGRDRRARPARRDRDLEPGRRGDVRGAGRGRDRPLLRRAGRARGRAGRVCPRGGRSPRGPHAHRAHDPSAPRRLAFPGAGVGGAAHAPRRQLERLAVPHPGHHRPRRDRARAGGTGRPARRSNTELERFAYAASHDLQEPLQSIKLSAGAVIATAEERLDADERELIGHIDTAVTRLSDQIRALMQVAQVALGAGPGERVKLSVAVRDAVDALRGAAVEARAEIVVHEPLPAVEVPRTEVALVLQNVIANAIKYRRDGVRPQVEIAAEVGEQTVEVRVADNGVGLSPADLERVFGLFARGDTDAPGTGMGLAVARRMLEHQGGSLAAQSVGPGQGSEFTLSLPI